MFTLVQYSLILSIALLVILVIVLLFKLKRLQSRVDAQLKQTQISLEDLFNQYLRDNTERIYQDIRHLQRDTKDTQASILTMQSAIDDGKTQVLALKDMLNEYQHQDPEVRLYQQARELIAQGVGIDEIVDSCGIPRAEAELLFSLSSKDGGG